jgi:DNA-binding response OmpR family regulator
MMIAKKILVVDDEADLLKFMLFRLNRTGYEAWGATDGREALEAVRQKIPDLMILDVYLPVLKGDEVAKIFKSDRKLKNIPILLISADGGTLERRARESGADDYLAKGFEFTELTARVGKLLAKGDRSGRRSYRPAKKRIGQPLSAIFENHPGGG